VLIVSELYWMDDVAGPYTQLFAFTRIYYTTPPGGVAVPFPKGLRMLVGDPNSKSALATHKWTCHAASGDVLRADFNFDSLCENGLAVTVYFPSCWDGTNLYLQGNGHVIEPSGSSCPASHPVRVPKIQLEFQFATNKYRPGVPIAGHVILANGDTTGYGMHADFVEGWDLDLLGRALKDPGCNTGEAM
jgi:hypothetical protein